MSFEIHGVPHPRKHGALRLEEVDACLLLPQILRLRELAWARRVSLAPDASLRRDASDVGAIHWCVFNDAEVVAAGRMSLHDSPDALADCALSTCELGRLLMPMAMMSHCAVHPLFDGLHLEKALDAARIERADRMRHRSLLTMATSAARVAALEALGFQPIGALRKPRRARPVALVLDLSRRLVIPGSTRLTRPL